MVKLKQLSSLLVHDRKQFEILLFRKMAPLYKDDEKYLKKLFKMSLGYDLNIVNPQTFNEKLNWIKLYNRNPIYTSMADKYEVKAFVAERIGEEYVVENYGVWNSWEEIDFSTLPNQFVLKGTHDSGGAFVCRDKESFDYTFVGDQLKKNLKRDFYTSSREWPYKNIPHRIIADQLLDDHTGNELRDYKFWCFNGKPTYMYCTVKTSMDNTFENFYDMDFKPVMIDHGFPRHRPEFEKPSQFELMRKLASVLSKNIPFVRVDFFQVENKVYFGEFTFFDWAGLRPFGGDWDTRLGELIVLNKD